MRQSGRNLPRSPPARDLGSQEAPDLVTSVVAVPPCRSMYCGRQRVSGGMSWDPDCANRDSQRRLARSARLPAPATPLRPRRRPCHPDRRMSQLLSSTARRARRYPRNSRADRAPFFFLPSAAPGFFAAVRNPRAGPPTPAALLVRQPLRRVGWIGRSGPAARRVGLRRGRLEWDDLLHHPFPPERSFLRRPRSPRVMQAPASRIA